MRRVAAAFVAGLAVVTAAAGADAVVGSADGPVRAAQASEAADHAEHTDRAEEAADRAAHQRHGTEQHGAHRTSSTNRVQRTSAERPRRRARPQVALSGTDAVVGADRGFVVRLACRARKRACAGVVSPRVGAQSGPAVGYRLGARRIGTVRLRLTPGAFALLPAGRVAAARLVVTERRPARLPARALPLRLRRPAVPVPPAPPPAASEAFANRNWTPTTYDTCSADLHRDYSVVGPDGKLYPTWHPPVVTDPATGQECSFGHEHGDDPRSSDVWELVADQFRSPAHPTRAGVPFGYVSEQLTLYAGQRAGTATRHEDNVGHKIIVANDVRLVTASPRGFVYTTDDEGERVPVTCDFLMKVHQGSHSSDATANNAHELFYAATCNDGTEIATATMTRFGDPNQFHRSCDDSVVVTTGGSNLPPGDGGRRRIPDRDCIDEYVLVDPAVPGAHSDLWGLYEVWESVNTITAADGRTLVSFDPWFGVRNPSRYHREVGVVGHPVTAAWETDPSDGGVTDAPPWLALMSLEPFGQRDPRSPFDGAQRDFYLGETEVSNLGGPAVWYTDPYGGQGSTTPFVGSVAQRISPSDNVAYPTLERRVFDRDADFGAGLDLHAPN